MEKEDNNEWDVSDFDALNLEDVFLKAAFKELAEEDGKRYLEEALNSTDLDCPPHVHNRFIADLMRIRKQNQRMRIKRMAVVAAVIIALSISLALAFAMHTQDLRVRAADNGVYAEVEINANEGADALDELNWSSYYLPTYIPAGYVVVASQDVASRRITTYKQGESGLLYFTQILDADATTNIDNEVDDSRQVYINDQSGYVTRKGETCMLYWVQDDVICALESSTISEKELIKIAASLTKMEE